MSKPKRSVAVAEEGLFWLTVAIVAVVAVVAFKVLGGSAIGERIPALKRLAGSI